MRSGRRPSFQPRLECLEDRTLMAAHLTASLSDGLLRIDGTGGNDQIVVRQSNYRISVDGTDIRVKGVGAVHSVKASDVSVLNVRGLEGDDVIILGGDETSGPN